MKVRAKQRGQYKDVVYEPGQVFEIDDKPLESYKIGPTGSIEKDFNGKPVVDKTRSPLLEWMEEVKPGQGTDKVSASKPGEPFRPINLFKTDSVTRAPSPEPAPEGSPAPASHKPEGPINDQSRR